MTFDSSDNYFNVQYSYTTHTGQISGDGRSSISNETTSEDPGVDRVERMIDNDLPLPTGNE
jgi:hypothetical protein